MGVCTIAARFMCEIHHMFSFFSFTIYKVIRSYIQITLSLYEIKYNIDSIAHFAYLKTFDDSFNPLKLG